MPSPIIPAYDRAAICAHIELLHGLAAGVAGQLVLCVFFEGRAGVITHHKIGDVDGMVAAVMAHASTPGANVYTGLHAMRHGLRRGTRGTKSDIVAVLGLVADMDADTGKVGTMPVEASYVIETSPGNSQSAILFDKPMLPKIAEPLAKAFQKATSSDSGTGDIAHVWRLPGTLNYPSAAKLARNRDPEPAPVSMTESFAGLVYSEDTLVITLAPRVVEPAPDQVHRFTGSVATGALWNRLTDTRRAILTSSGEPDRSAHAARVVEHLHHAGFTLDEIVSICLERPGAWSERYKDNLALIKDIERCWTRFAAPKEVEKDDNAAAVEAFLDHQSSTPRPPPPPHHSDPFCLAAPGGMLSELARWIYETSPSPIADFCVMSAIALYAGLFGRRYLTPNGLGLNLYIALVAGSGFGKDHPLKALKQIASSIDREYLVGQNDFASDSALEYALRHQPCLVLPLDELGMLMSASGKMADSHARAKRKALLELYSSARSDWVAKIRAGDAGTHNAPPKPSIKWPTLSFLGATTPSTFYDGLGGDAFSSGFMARLIVVSISIAPNLQRIDGFPEVPEWLIARLKDAVGSIQGSKGPFGEAVSRDPYTKPNYTVVGWADEAAALRCEQVQLWARTVGIANERRGEIVNRAGDHTIKLATIRAISRDPANPLVSIEDIEWAFAIVHRSIETVEDGANRFMSSSPFEALCKAIMEAVRNCKDVRGLKNADLLRKHGVSQADPRSFDAALIRLIDGTGELVNVGKGRGKGGRYRLATVH